MPTLLPLVLLLLLGACAGRQAARPAPATVVVEAAPSDEPPADWRAVALGEDQARLATLQERLRARLAALTSVPEILRQASAPRWPQPTPGTYACRMHRVAEDRTVAYRAFTCFVQADGEFLTLSKSGGTERPAGRLWQRDDATLVFLGGAGRPGGEGAAPYGEDAATNRVGLLERVGDFRWRLLIDASAPGGTIDVLELWPHPVSVAASQTR